MICPDQLVNQLISKEVEFKDLIAWGIKENLDLFLIH